MWRPTALERGWITRFPSKWELMEYVGKVHKWTAEKRGRVPYQRVEAPRVVVRKNAKYVWSRSFAYPGLNKIKIGRLDTHSTLHELGHIYAPPGEGHNPLFLVSYLALVREFMGVEAAQHLEECLLAKRVRITPKRTRAKRAPMSAERKAQLAEQLKKARAARAAKRPAPPKFYPAKAADNAGPVALSNLLRWR
jgi:hypothetical protein